MERLGLFYGGVEAVPYGTAFNGDPEAFAVTLAVLLLRHKDVDGVSADAHGMIGHIRDDPGVQALRGHIPVFQVDAHDGEDAVDEAGADHLNGSPQVKGTRAGLTDDFGLAFEHGLCLHASEPGIVDGELEKRFFLCHGVYFPLAGSMHSTPCM